MVEDRNELISVIVPIYKVERYLDSCICSIVNQTYKNIEIILVNDGSPDLCPQICKKWEQIDERIYVINKINGGLSDARNCGIAFASGKYLSFIDSDDYIDSHFIEYLYNAIRETNSDISMCAYSMVYEKKKTAAEDDKQKKCRIEIYSKEEALKLLLSTNSFGDYAWNKLYKRKLFDLVKYPIGSVMEDIGTTYLLFDQCDKISYINRKLYYYVQRDESILHNLDAKYHIDKFDLSYRRYLYLINKYPNMLENKVFFAYIIIADYSYVNYSEKKKALDELKIIWPMVKNKIKIKYRILGLLLLYFPELYERIYK